MKEVLPIEIKNKMTVNQLVKAFGKSGVFQAGNLARAVDIYEEMLKKKSSVMLAFAGAMVPGGMRKVIADLVRDGMVDLIVTTGANITHDLACAFGEKYYVCGDRVDDEQFRKKGISRIYDVASPDSTSIGFEKGIQKVFSQIGEGDYSTPELMDEIGKRIKDKDSIARQAHLKKIPLFVPALEDSILGIQLWIHSQDRKVKLDPLKDIKQITDWVYDHKNRGVISLGGGVPKNFALQSALIPGPHNYAIQVTLDRPESGGLSGATLEEAISWGKLTRKSKFVCVYSDSTIVFPVIVAAVRERLNSRV
jgi:deoxyhypusine synthase